MPICWAFQTHTLDVKPQKKIQMKNVNRLLFIKARDQSEIIKAANYKMGKSQIRNNTKNWEKTFF